MYFYPTIKIYLIEVRYRGLLEFSINLNELKYDFMNDKIYDCRQQLDHMRSKFRLFVITKEF